MTDSKKEQAFDWARFIKVQQSLPNVNKAGRGNFGEYMKLDDLNPAMLKVLNKHDFAWITQPTVQDGKQCLKYTLVDCKSGATLSDIMELATEKLTPQGQGSAITYARRYSLTAVTGLVADMDDDGEEASKEPTDKTKSLEQLTELVNNAKDKDELRKVYAGLSPKEKQIALPIMTAKISENEAA